MSRHTHPCPKCYRMAPCDDCDCDPVWTSGPGEPPSYPHAVCESCNRARESRQAIDELRRELPDMLRLDAKFRDDGNRANAKEAARHRRLLLRALRDLPSIIERWDEVRSLCALGMRMAATHLRSASSDPAERERLAAAIDADADRLEARP